MNGCRNVTFEQHERALTWRAKCQDCTWRGHWRASPDRALDDHRKHQAGDDRSGFYERAT